MTSCLYGVPVSAAPVTPTIGATITSHTIPATMTAGNSYQVTVTVTNTGTIPWTEATAFHLGVLNDSLTWGPNRYSMPAAITVQSQASYTFSFTMTAPAVTGSYTYGLQMVRDGYGTNYGWFGNKVTTPISVAAAVTPANFVIDPTVIITPPNPGLGASVTISGIVRNTGGTPGSVTVYAKMGGETMGSAVYAVGSNNGATVSIQFYIPQTLAPGDYATCLAL